MAAGQHWKLNGRGMSRYDAGVASKTAYESYGSTALSTGQNLKVQAKFKS